MTKTRAAKWCIGFGALGVGCLPTADATRPIALTSAWPDAPAPPVDALRLHRCDDTLGVTVLPNGDGPIEAPAGPWCGLDIVSRDPWVGEATISDGRAITFNITLDDVAWRTDEAWTGAAWTLTFAEGADAVFAALTESEWTVDASSDTALVASLRAVTLRATDADVDATPLAVWPPAR
jgi:hypothetical protein